MRGGFDWRFLRSKRGLQEYMACFANILPVIRFSLKLDGKHTQC
jgi:hypothetical protein